MSCPVISFDEAAASVLDVFGLSGTFSKLDSCQDANFKLKTIDGLLFVVKFANINTPYKELQFQNDILMHLSRYPIPGVSFPIPISVRSAGNETIAEVNIGGLNYLLRVLTFVSGNLLSDFHYLSSDVLKSFGGFVFALNSSLRKFDGDICHRNSEWDIRNGFNKILEYSALSNSTETNKNFIEVATTLNELITDLQRSFYSQIIHCDLAHYNVIAMRQLDGRPKITGVIDFGDVVESWLIGDLAIAIVPLLSYVDLDTAGPCGADSGRSCVHCAGEVLYGYQVEAHLKNEAGVFNSSEIEALWPLVVLRCIAMVTVLQYQLSVDPHNQYCRDELQLILKVVTRLMAVPMYYATRYFEIVAGDAARAAGVSVAMPHGDGIRRIESPVEPPSTPQPLFGHGGGIVYLDIGVESQSHSAGSWLLGDIDKSSSMQQQHHCGCAEALAEGRWRSAVAAALLLHNNKTTSAAAAVGLDTCIDHKASPSSVFVIPYGRPQLHRSTLRSLQAPHSMPLHSTLLVARGEAITAPWSCRIRYLRTPLTLKATSTFPSRISELMCCTDYRSRDVNSSSYANCCATMTAPNSVALLQYYGSLDDSVTTQPTISLLLWGDFVNNLQCDSIDLTPSTIFSVSAGQKFAEASDPSIAIAGNDFCVVRVQQLPPGIDISSLFQQQSTEENNSGGVSAYAHRNRPRSFHARFSPPMYCAGKHEECRVWRSLCPDPLELFPLTPSTTAAAAVADNSLLPLSAGYEALEKRYKYFAGVQEHYFKIPPNIERGYGAFLYDNYGRSYLDMVNNVAAVGHCHPAVRRAAMDQLNLLNTNSRFIYKLLGEYTEQIISTIPLEIVAAGQLNTVLLVNSGSEATDLALRIARTVVTERTRRAAAEAAETAAISVAALREGATVANHSSGTSSNADSSLRSSPPTETTTAALSSSMIPLKRDVICMTGGYHGVTTASDEVSTTLNDNPRSLETRAPWIHLAPMPNMYRGLFNVHQSRGSLQHGSVAPSDDDARQQFVELYADTIRKLVERLTREGKAPAAFIAEPLSGNAGGVEIPKGYLAEVYGIVRAHGGLCICDEVQVGFGRLGTHFWGFLEHGVVPDIVTMAKACGNGHPLGFVITSKQIAAEFGADGSFFSSAGGNPVSCAVGLSVLNIIRSEGLQRNALEVGTHLHEQLLLLATRFPNIVGCVHGHGFYQGIELVLGGEGCAIPPIPATSAAYAICERLKQLGVICHNTGDYSNVLKVKPPMCFSREDADFVIQALEKVFKEGW